MLGKACSRDQPATVSWGTRKLLWCYFRSGRARATRKRRHAASVSGTGPVAGTSEFDNVLCLLPDLFRSFLSLVSFFLSLFFLSHSRLLSFAGAETLVTIHIDVGSGSLSSHVTIVTTGYQALCHLPRKKNTHIAKPGKANKTRRNGQWPLRKSAAWLGFTEFCRAHRVCFFFHGFLRVIVAQQNVVWLGVFPKKKNLIPRLHPKYLSSPFSMDVS